MPLEDEIKIGTAKPIPSKRIPAKRKRSIRKTVWLFFVGASSLIICSSMTWSISVFALALEGFSSAASAVTGGPATWGVVSVVVGIALQALVIVGIWFLLKGASRFYDAVVRENRDHLRKTLRG